MCINIYGVLYMHMCVDSQQRPLPLTSSGVDRLTSSGVYRFHRSTTIVRKHASIAVEAFCSSSPCIAPLCKSCSLVVAMADVSTVTRVQRRCQDFESWRSFLRQPEWDDIQECPSMATEVKHLTN